MNSALIPLPPIAAAAPAKTARLTRTGDRIRSANRWRAQYDPLRSFTLSRAVALREAWFRGEMADVQWTYLWAETSDPDLFALRELRSAAIAEMDWNIKTVSDDSADFDPALAEDQAHALRAAYDAIPNLTEVIDHLATATFRGYAHVEKQRAADGRIARLEIVDQWNVVRDGFRGAWRYNPEARNTNFEGLADQPELNDDNCIISLGTDRHINFYALPKFVRCSMVEKDWTAFLEIYGLPSGVITMGPNQNPDAAADEAEAAASIAEGGSGVIPYGATYSPNDSPRGVDPFSPFLRAFSEKLILVGTGGKLTMLAESGAGTLAGNAHADTFRTIARAEARRINSLLQRHLDRDLLAREFPGQPVLAYFELDYQEKADPAALIDQAVKLKAAGFNVDPEELSEKTGWSLSAAAPEAEAAKAKGKRQKEKGEEQQPEAESQESEIANSAPILPFAFPLLPSSTTPTVQNRREGLLQGPARGGKPGGAVLTLPADQNASYAKSATEADKAKGERQKAKGSDQPADDIANAAAAPATASGLPFSFKLLPSPVAALRAAFAEIEKLTDPDAQRAALLALRERLPDHLRHLNRTPALAPVIESALATGWLEALTANPQTPAAPPAKATAGDVVTNTANQP